MKVTTTAGNIFYTNVETKVSSWTIPEEIKEHVKLYEEAQARKAEELRLAEVEQARAKAEEAKRIHEAEQRRMIELEVQKVRAEVEAEAQLRGLKRKNDDPSEPGQPSAQPPANPSTGSESDRLAKLAKLEPSAQPENDQDEDWQRQIAEEMAQEAAEQSGTSIPHPTTAVTTTNPPPAATITKPGPTGLSLEELKATFKVRFSLSLSSDRLTHRSSTFSSHSILPGNVARKINRSDGTMG
jgi:transcription elongation regulator 1